MSDLPDRQAHTPARSARACHFRIVCEGSHPPAATPGHSRSTHRRRSLPTVQFVLHDVEPYLLAAAHFVQSLQPVAFLGRVLIAHRASDVLHRVLTSRIRIRSDRCTHEQQSAQPCRRSIALVHPRADVSARRSRGNYHSRRTGLGESRTGTHQHAGHSLRWVACPRNTGTTNSPFPPFTKCRHERTAHGRATAKHDLDQSLSGSSRRHYTAGSVVEEPVMYKVCVATALAGTAIASPAAPPPRRPRPDSIGR